MTRLVKFLILLSGLAAIWIVLLKTFYDENDPIFNYILLPLPLHAVIIFGIVSAFVVLHRTFNFNDCPEASKELNEQIAEARADLKRKGFKFQS